MTKIIIYLFSLSLVFIPTYSMAQSCQITIDENMYKQYLLEVNKNKIIFSNEDFDEFTMKQFDENEAFRLDFLITILKHHEAFVNLDAPSFKCILADFFSGMRPFISRGNFISEEIKSSFLNIINSFSLHLMPENKKTLTIEVINFLESIHNKNIGLEFIDFIVNNIDQELLKEILNKSDIINRLLNNVSSSDKLEYIQRPVKANDKLKELLESESQYKKMIEQKSSVDFINNPMFESGLKPKNIDNFLSESSQKLDLFQLSMLFRQYNFVNLLSPNLILDKNKQCEVAEKLIFPLEQYRYSPHMTQIVDKLSLINLDCLNSKMSKSAQYPTSSEKYFSKWCKDLKDVELCKNYFSEKWLGQVKMCNINSDCNAVHSANQYSFYFNKSANMEIISFYLERLNFMINSNSPYLKTTPQPICAQKVCKPR